MFYSFVDVIITCEGFQIVTSAFMAIEQWKFFSVQHLLWHRDSVHTCNDNLKEPVTLIPVAERLAMVLSLAFEAKFIAYQSVFVLF